MTRTVSTALVTGLLVLTGCAAVPRDDVHATMSTERLARMVLTPNLATRIDEVLNLAGDLRDPAATCARALADLERSTPNATPVTRLTLSTVQREPTWAVTTNRSYDDLRAVFVRGTKWAFRLL